MGDENEAYLTFSIAEEFTVAVLIYIWCLRELATDVDWHTRKGKLFYAVQWNTGLSKKMDGIWNRYNLKSTRRIYTFGVLKCSEKFKVLDLP